MLQRAASNAYSWWWASHIRTKQSKWLDNNLQDMEDRVKGMLKLIEEDADTFAKKAEMYFRRRPELINFVQESYKSYRALAERYDHISGELHKANNTIATVFPDQAQFGMDDEEDDNYPRAAAVDVSKVSSPSRFTVNEDVRSPTAQVRLKHKETGSQEDVAGKAQEEINKLQKEILVLQTEKEFIKGSCEIGLTKYRDIEKNISEKQQKVCSLQDEHCATAVIEDEEARALMAVTALKSCEDTLINLHEQQKRSTEEARMESQRIKNAREKLRAIRSGQQQVEDQDSSQETADLSSVSENLEEVFSLSQARLELHSVCEKVMKNFEMNSEVSVLNLAEKIDELVSKVIELESTVSSQISQIQRLRLENDELQENLQNLEEHNTMYINDAKGLCDKLRQAEEEFHKVQDLDKCVQDESTKLQTHFSEACSTFKVLSDKLQSPEQQAGVKIADSTEERDITPSEQEGDQMNEEKPVNAYNIVKAVADISTILTSNILQEGAIGMENSISSKGEDPAHEADCNPNNVTEKSEKPEPEDKVDRTGPSQENHDSYVNSGQQTEVSSKDTPARKVEELKKEVEVKRIGSSSEEDQDSHANDDHGTNSEHDHGDFSAPNWQQLFLNGLEDREKILLAEYTSILRNFKDTKRKLAEAEKKSQDNMFETMAQVRNLKSTILMRDDEIRSLRQQLNFLGADRNQHADSHKAEPESSRQLSTFTENSGTLNSEGRKDRNEESDGIDETELREAASQGPLTEGMNLHLIGEPCATSEIEEKFRRDIDELLEENLEFWLRFSSSIQQIQKYRMAVQETQVEIPKLRYSKKQEGSGSSSREYSMKPEATTIYKQLSDLDTDLSVWIEQNALLKEELQSRFSSLCNIKEEISGASQKERIEGKEVTFSAYQASKFQGEVLNMLQENNKVADELQAGLHHVRGLQAEVQQALGRLNENFELSSSKGQNQNYFKNFSSRTRVPLRSFLFNAKPKKPSLFACMNPALQKQYSDLTAGLPP